MLKLSTMLLSQELNTAFVPSFTEFVQMVSLHLAGYTLYYTLTYMICFCFITDVLQNVLTMFCRLRHHGTVTLSIVRF